MKLWIILTIAAVAGVAAALLLPPALAIDRVDAAIFPLRAIATASKQFHAKNGRWPESLGVLTNSDNGSPYLELGTRGPVDRWGHPILYFPYSSNTQCGIVVSLGEDGQPGGDKQNRDRVVLLK
jgi:type II secretory pathway pseudopilin PulG